MTLRCISPYRAKAVSYAAGQIITDLTPAQEAWLLADSFGSFEMLADPIVLDSSPPPMRAMTAPPQHRAMLEPEGHRTTAGEDITHAESEQHVMTPDNFGASKLPEHRSKRRR